MAKGGGRKYNRDKNGRFASTGGGGGGSKAAGTRKANSSRAADLKAKGTTAIGGRVKAKGFAGGKGAQERAGGLRNQKRIMYTGKGSGPRTSASMGTIGVSPRQVARVRAKSQQSAASAPAPKAKKRGINLGSRRPGTSAPEGTIAKGRVARLYGSRQMNGPGYASKATPAPAPKAKAGPKTAAGRASANLKRADKARRANPYDKKAANSLITAQAAKDYYKTMGGGRKGAAKPKRKGKK
jgi:hypothetical protein